MNLAGYAALVLIGCSIVYGGVILPGLLVLLLVFAAIIIDVAKGRL